MSNEENSKLIKSILKILLLIFIMIFIYILLMINKELKITNIIFTIIKIASPLFFGIFKKEMLSFNTKHNDSAAFFSTIAFLH